MFHLKSRLHDRRDTSEIENQERKENDINVRMSTLLLVLVEADRGKIKPSKNGSGQDVSQITKKWRDLSDRLEHFSSSLL